MRTRPLLPALLLALLLAGCAALRDGLNPQPPSASVAGARITGLGFDHAVVALDVRVQNPNAIAIRLTGFDYRLRVDGRPALSGERRQRLELGANETTRMEIPLRVDFGTIAGLLGGLAGRDSIAWELDLGLEVEIPILGGRRVEASTDGTLPVPHRPELSLQSLRLQRLTADGALLALNLGVANPNGFALALDRLDWTLEVEGERWARGGSTAPLRVPANGEGTLRLTFELDLDSLGRGGYALLVGGDPLDYTLRATLTATAADERLGRFELPWNSSGRVDLR
ncbi:MAG: LEA type 2 family protein [Halofilum sp. (in: g-proteobacteria)]|nr:LEA type 2 family protein [Halofilum sp. (in: g-proteobacteria)]